MPNSLTKFLILPRSAALALLTAPILLMAALRSAELLIAPNASRPRNAKLLVILRIPAAMMLPPATLNICPKSRPPRALFAPLAMRPIALSTARMPPSAPAVSAENFTRRSATVGISPPPHHFSLNRLINRLSGERPIHPGHRLGGQVPRRNPQVLGRTNQPIPILHLTQGPVR